MSAVEPALFLLCTRVVVEAVLASRLPTYTSVAEGRETLRSIDRLVTALVDPYGVMSHIVPLESAPQALKVLRFKKPPPRVSGLATSPIVQFILGDCCGSAEAKRMAVTSLAKSEAVERGLAELRKHLSPLVRSRLLRVLQEAKLHSPSAGMHGS